MFEDSLGSISSQLKKAKKNKASTKLDPPEEAGHSKSEDKPKKILREEHTGTRNYKENRYQSTPPKRKEYPERTFDKFIQKGARLRPEDIDIMKTFCSEISHARRFVSAENRQIKRITDNTIIRLLVSQFCEKIEGDLGNIDFSKIQTEEQLDRYISEIMRF